PSTTIASPSAGSVAAALSRAARSESGLPFVAMISEKRMAAQDRAGHSGSATETGVPRVEKRSHARLIGDCGKDDESRRSCRLARRVGRVQRGLLGVDG